MKKIFILSLIWCVVGIFAYTYTFCLLNKVESIPRENREYTTAIITHTDSKLTEFKFKEVGGRECIGEFYGEDKYQLPVNSKVVIAYDVTNPQVSYINIPSLYYEKQWSVYIFTALLFLTGVGAIISYFINKVLYTDIVKNSRDEAVELEIANDILGTQNIKYSTIIFVIFMAAVFVEIFQIYLYGVEAETIVITLIIAIPSLGLWYLAKKMNR